MEISRLVAKTSINANFRLILIASQARRGLMDRLVLVLCFLFFIF
jgi:hypothetical protein